MPPGSRHTEAKVWVENEQTLVILKQHAAWSGNLRRDITNFFRYRHLVRGLAGVVCPTALAWGEHAEAWPVEQWSPAQSLDSFAYLWTAFLEGLDQIDPTVANLAWLEPEFRRMARSEGVIGG